MLVTFEVFVVAHIITGIVGLVSFWFPVISKKGRRLHRRSGDVFAWALTATGVFATGMAICTLIDPIGTHPKLTPDTIPSVNDPDLVRGLFGWMMVYLAVLTISLAWHGRLVIKNRDDRRASRTRLNVGLQWATIAAALNCMGQGWLLGQPLMQFMPIVGVASGVTNLVFLHGTKPSRSAYLKEHIKALVGAGISVYIAFMTFGLARLLPEQAFDPMLWAIPLGIGLAIIIWHHVAIDLADRRRAAARADTPPLRGAAA